MPVHCPSSLPPNVYRCLPVKNILRSKPNAIPVDETETVRFPPESRSPSTGFPTIVQDGACIQCRLQVPSPSRGVQ
jgi:hypothetical protein